MANPIYMLKVGKQTYRFDPDALLTVGALRQIKQRYGIEIGRYNSFIAALLQGDPEAALCAVWLARKATGEQNVPEPNELPDFSLSGWIDLEKVPEEEQENPTQPDLQTHDSTETQTNSEHDS